MTSHSSHSVTAVTPLPHRTKETASSATTTTARNTSRARRTEAYTGTWSHDEKLTISDLCADLQISRSTFYDWRAKGRAPRCIKLPNGDLRIRRSDYELWLDAREAAA